MAVVPYALGAYRRADLPRLRLVNQYPEKSQASRAGVILLPRPGLQEYAEWGNGPIQGIFRQPGALNNVLFAVSGGDLYASGANLGSVATNTRVSMAASATQLLIGGGSALFIYEDGAVSAVAFPDGAPVSSVAYINGYFIASRAGTQQFYWSTVLDGSQWDGLDFASAERETDNIVALRIVSDQLWIFGETTTEVWTTTGDADAPFQRVDGRLYDKGCRARDTIANVDNSVFWVGHDGVVYRGDSSPLRISDHTIEQAIQESSPDDLRAWAFAWFGHVFYCLTTAKGTFAYDPATQEWPEFSSYQRPSWRAHIGIQVDNDIIAGDDETGTLWKLSDDILLDGEDAIQRIHTGVVEQRGILSNLVLDATTGGAVTPVEQNPLVELRISRDQGQTFAAWRQSSLGSQGQYRRRAVWRALGLSDGDGMVIEFRMSDPTPWRLSAMRANEPLSGRGRPS